MQYDGDSLHYYSKAQGFCGYQITGITEDAESNIWFATDQGVVKYDWAHDDGGEKQFVNYTDDKYFGGQRFWSICADNKGHIWAGGSRSIFRYDGHEWRTFDLPYPETIEGSFITKATSWSILEDSHGHMWFSTNGFGAYRYDGQTVTQFSKKEGLVDNAVDVMLESGDGHMWFGTRWGGASEYDGKSYTCLLYTSPSPRDGLLSRMPSSA